MPESEGRKAFLRKQFFRLLPVQILLIAIGCLNSVIDGAVGSSRRLWVTIRDTLSLLLVAVALTPAFKMRFWNVGGEGQVLIGASRPSRWISW